MILIRRQIGDVLRSARQQQGRTLREVSGAARVSLGYLSEVERGQKEASSELLSSICQALELPMSAVLHEVSARVAAIEGTVVEPVAAAPVAVTPMASVDGPVAAPAGPVVADALDAELAAVTGAPSVHDPDRSATPAPGRPELVSAA